MERISALHIETAKLTLLTPYSLALEIWVENLGDLSLVNCKDVVDIEIESWMCGILSTSLL
jgi:hypothetical protein